MIGHDNEPVTAKQILVVDDLRDFDFAATYARNLIEAMARLDEPWDELWLDHDLGMDAAGNLSTTRPLALELERRAIEGDPARIGQIFIHSSNGVGASWLLSSLAPHYSTTRVLLSRV